MKALIVGTDYDNHEIYVGERFLLSHETGSWEWYNGDLNQTVINYAKNNGFDVIIYSYSNLQDYFVLAEQNLDIMIFMPSYNYNSGSLQQLVITEHYPTKESNSVFEFGDWASPADSFSNGYIAGQICEIAKQRNCTLAEARIVANLTVSDATHKYISMDDAVSYDGEIKLSVRSLISIRNILNNFTFTLERITDATNYEIEIEDVEVIQTTALTYNYELLINGVRRVRYRGYNADLTSDWSEWIDIKYKILNKLLVKL